MEKNRAGSGAERQGIGPANGQHAAEYTWGRRALRQHGGNVSRTAQTIGMVRQSLQQKIRELDLRSEDWSGETQSKGDKS